MKKFKLLGVLMGLLLTGQFAFSQAGSTFSNPQVVSALPFVAVGDSTCGYGDNYDTGDISCTGNYLDGDEKIYSFTPSSNISNFNVELTNIATSWSGIFITDDSTTSGNCLGNVGSSGTSTRGVYGVSLTAGTTYYILVSTWATPQCITSYDINMYSISCPEPTALTVTGITTSTAQLGWTEAGSATLWQYEYDTAGFTQGTGTIDTTSSNPYTATSLTSATDYEFYVRAVCGAGDTSDWAGPFSFVTSCNPTVAPMTESFDGNSTPTCWSQTAVTGGPWVFSGSPDYGASSATDHTGNGGSFAWMDQSSSDEAVSLIMNDVDVSALTTAYLKFYYYVNNVDNNDTNDLIIEAWNGSAWAQVDSLHVNNGGWTPYWYDLSSFTYGSNLVKIRFRAESGGGTGDYYQDQLLDDVSVMEMPSCFEPSALTLDNMTYSSATMSWTENGSATLWQFEYDTAGFTQGTGNMDTTSMNPGTITGLTQLTDYNVYVRAICGAGDTSIWAGPISFSTPPSCPAPDTLEATDITLTTANLNWSEMGSATLWQYEYDTTGFTQGTGTMDTTSMNPASITGLTPEKFYQFYVRAICGAGDTSTWTGPVSFYTGYCVPNPSSVDGDGITNVSMDTVNNTTGAEPGNYGNYTNLIANAQQQTNLAIDITLATGYTYNMWAFVDWNNDLDFDDAGEHVYLGESTNANPTVYSAVLPIPSTATLGQHRLRLGGSDSGLGSTAPSDPCYTGSYASFEDYTLNVLPPPSCFAPDSLDVTAVTNSTATLTWTQIGSPASWQIEWDTAGFTPGTGTITPASSNPFTLTNLDANENYEFYVRAICGPADSSVWSGMMSFSTAIDTIMTFPYINDLESGLGLYMGLRDSAQSYAGVDTVADNASTYGVLLTGKTSTGWSGGSTSTTETQAFVNNSSHISGIDMIVDATSLTSLELQYDLKQTYTYGNKYSWTRVLVNGTQVGLSVNPTTDDNDPFVTMSVDLSSYAGTSFSLSIEHSGKYDVANGTGGRGDDAYVDNVKLFVPLTATAVVDSNVTCNGMSNGGATVTATNGVMPYIYLWSNSATTASITGVTAGTYDVTVSDAAGDSVMTSVTITEPGQVVVSLGNDTSICVNDLLTLDAGAGFSSYLWDNGATTQTRIVNSTMAASNAYSVIVTDANGCNGYDTVNVDVNAPMMPNLGNDTTICYDATLVLDAGAGFNSYLWDDASTLQTRDVVGATVGSAVHTMYVATTDANMCTGTDTIIVTVDAEITVDLGNDTTVCSGTTFDLDAGAGYASYLWDDLSTLQTRTVATNAAGATNYSVIVTTTAGCIGTSTIEVTGRAPVVVDLGPDTTIGWWGADTTYTLDAGAGFASYLWSDNVTTTQTFVVNKDNMGLIGVVVTDANGCIGTDTVRVDFLLSVPSFDVSTLKMYPNPASDLINIEMSNFNNVDEVNVKFISITGEVVLRRQINVNAGAYQETFDVSHLATGTYFVQFEAKGEVVTRKFVIK
ncbi:fibronectin type III domain-containing protein [bacterium SCSIO 12643]|nr:fibronectin type III domain-containing protein [bacterium SCSIO 12643]